MTWRAYLWWHVGQRADLFCGHIAVCGVEGLLIEMLTYSVDT